MTGTSTAGSAVFKWTFAGAEFDEARWELTVNGRVVDLERKPLQVLAHLLRHAGEVLTKDELLDAVWPGRVVVEAALTNAIGKLRRALCDEAQTLIVTVPRVGYRLSGTVTRKAIATLPPDSRLSPGDPVPRRPTWRLLEPLSRQDDSEVWLAEHPKTHERRVFKFSLAGERLAGLKREVTISRLLDQSTATGPSFIRVMDWDFDQAPYFLESEYGGVDLSRWLAGDGTDSTRAERLDLLAQAAEAIAQAHEIGVLHKDIKPSNLLVDGRPGEWIARVVDFGSGRLLEPSRLDSLGITRLGLTQLDPGASDGTGGTPLYLAPEVIAGQAPTLKSDLYALGVILFQLLVGNFHRPMAPGWEEDVDDELLRRDIADFANGDPSRRPASARELAERLRTLDQRHQRLDLERSVQDRIATNEKRLAKIRARRPWVVAAMLLLAAGLGVTLQMYRAIRASNERALLERDTAVALSRFVTHDILGATDPMRAGREGMTMRDALDLGAKSIATRFSGQPALAAPMHEAVASAYYQLSQYAAAHKHFRAAAVAYSLVGGPSSVEALRANVVAAEAQIRGGVPGTRSLLDDLATRIARLPASDQPLLWVYLDRARAQAAFANVDLKGAIPPLDHAAAQLALIPDVDPMLEVSIQQARTIAYARAGLPPPTLPPLPRALESSMPMRLSMRYAAVRVRMIAGDERLLEDEYRQIVGELARTLGPRAEPTLLAQHGLAHIYYKQEKFDQCEPLARRTGTALAEVLGAGHVHTRNATNVLASCLVGAGKWDEVRRTVEPVLAMPPVEGKAAKLLQAALKMNLAHAEAAAGRWDRVERLTREAKLDAGKLLSLDSDGVGEIALLDGQLAAAHGQKEEARRLLSEARSELLKKNPEGFWAVQRATQSLAAL